MASLLVREKELNAENYQCSQRRETLEDVVEDPETPSNSLTHHKTSSALVLLVDISTHVIGNECVCHFQGDKSLWVFLVAAYLVSRGTDSLCSRLSFFFN